MSGATGADLVVAALRGQGISTVFSLAGAAHFRLLDALDRDGFQIISARHESTAVVAADGYSRITNRVGVALVIAKQGLANAIGGLGSVFDACSPIVVLVARSPLSHDEPETAEDLDEVALARPVAKWVRTVHDASRLGDYIQIACRRALSGRPGPVVLMIPTDLLAARTEVDPALTLPPALAARPAPGPDSVDRALKLIREAERPMILAGSGSARSEAGPALCSLAARGIPVLGHALGRGLVPEDFVGGFPWAYAQVAAKQSDVVLVAGARISERLGYGREPRFHPDAQFIQIDVDAAEIGRNRPISVPICADSAATLAALDERLGTITWDTAWVHEAMAPRTARIAEIGLGDEGDVHPYRIARELASLMPNDAIWVGDGADALNWFSGILRVKKAPGYLDHYPYGSMGVGTPLAIGAAAAAREIAERTGEPARRVVLTTGDGAFGFYVSELNSAVLAGLPIVVVVANDAGWGTERHGQRKQIGRTVNVDLGLVRFGLVAQGYGCFGLDVTEPATIRAGLQSAFAERGPAVVNVVTDPEAGAVRKQDPRVQMIPHEDILAGKRPGYTAPVA